MVGVATYLLKHIPRKEVVRHTEETFAPFEEFRSLARLHRKDIVIEVEILLVEPLDAVQMHLDRVAVEGRQKLRRDNIFVDLQIADLVKFAKWQPLPDECERSFHQVSQFIDQTKEITIENSEKA